MDGIKVSIIVPVYNTHLYLGNCLDSLKSQSLEDIEIILVNDGSQDNSGDICDSYAKKDHRIRVIHQKNQGQTKARIAGLKIARGEYIHFVDSDDWLDKKMEEIMYNHAKENNADIVTCDSVFHKGKEEIAARQLFDAGVYNKQRLVDEVYPRMIYSGKFFYFGIYAAMWNKLFKRELIIPNIENINPAVRIGEDGLATFACFLDAQTVVITKDTLYHYRDDNSDSLTRSYCWEQFDSALLLIAYLRRIAKKHIHSIDINPQIDIYLLYNIKSIIIEEFYYRVKKTYRHRYQYLQRIITHPTVKSACDRIISSGQLAVNDESLFKLIQSDHLHSLMATAIRRGLDQRMRHFSRKITFSNNLSAKAYNSVQKTKMSRLQLIAK